MRSVEEIFDDLRKLGRIRRDIYGDAAVVDRDIGAVLGEAKDHPAVAMSDAAKAADVGRPLAYKLIGKSSRPDAE